MEKTVIGLDERELQRLNMILVDKDKEGAYDFLRDVVMQKIKEIPKGTGCYPQHDA
jgi:hypothetical protein